MAQTRLNYSKLYNLRNNVKPGEGLV